MSTLFQRTFIHLVVVDHLRDDGSTPPPPPLHPAPTILLQRLHLTPRQFFPMQCLNPQLGLLTQLQLLLPKVPSSHPILILIPHQLILVIYPSFLGGAADVGMLFLQGNGTFVAGNVERRSIGNVRCTKV